MVVRRNYPEDPNAMVGVKVWVPSSVRHLYETDELRGKMSKDVRNALQVRVQNNGYGLEGARRRYVELRERKVATDMEFESAKAEFFRLLRHGLEEQQDLLSKDMEPEILRQTFEVIRSRFAIWKKGQKSAPVPRGSKKNFALDWCKAEVDRNAVLRGKFPTPDALLAALEEVS